MVQLSGITVSLRDEKASARRPAAIYSYTIYSYSPTSASQDLQKFSGIQDLHCTGPTQRDKEVRYGQARDRETKGTGVEKQLLMPTAM